MESAAQIIGIAAMAFNVLSFQGKTVKRVMLCQLTGETLFAVNYMMLGAFGGGLLNVVAAFRSLVFLNRQVCKADHPAWMWIFCGIYLLSYAATFLVFGTAPTPVNFLLELLPVIGMVAVTVSLRAGSAAAIRRYGVISAVSWLIYSIAAFSIGAMLCESLSLISIAIGMARHDRKREESEI
ncbi:MAG: YgjV family protein [Clostridia bacterium]|nr:YgjV family protein [Clostridia bacterium]